MTDIDIKQFVRSVDVEITNRCNALCTFCPRDQMPDLGMMDIAVFKGVLERVREYGELRLFFAGFGEPLLHPQVIDFVRMAKAQGIFTGINTNGALLTESMARELLAAGIDVITFNVASFGDDYEELYSLDFTTTFDNIARFCALNASLGKGCEVWGYVVKNDLNVDRIGEVKKFWKTAGIKHFLVSEETNRAGALVTGDDLAFSGHNEYRGKAEAWLKANNPDARCIVPYASIFISYDGGYLLCCQDWRKQLPLGSIDMISFREMDKIKLDALVCGNKICSQCSEDPVNRLANAMFRESRYANGAGAVDEAVKYIQSHCIPFPIDDLR